MNRFLVKVPGLLTDTVFGLPNLHPDAKTVLDFICDFCERQGYAKPVVTQFGRARDEMEEIYFPFYLKDHPADVAHQLARSRFSWHCVSRLLGFVRAFDLRDWIYTEYQRNQIVAAVKLKFPGIENEDHAVAGGARHFHFAVPDPAGKPRDWR